MTSGLSVRSLPLETLAIGKLGNQVISRFTGRVDLYCSRLPDLQIIHELHSPVVTDLNPMQILLRVVRKCDRKCWPTPEEISEYDPYEESGRQSESLP